MHVNMHFKMHLKWKKMHFRFYGNYHKSNQYFGIFLSYLIFRGFEFFLTFSLIIKFKTLKIWFYYKRWFLLTNYPIFWLKNLRWRNFTKFNWFKLRYHLGLINGLLNYSASIDFVTLPLPSRYRPVTIPLPFLANVTHRLSPLPLRFSPSMTVYVRV